MHLVFLHGPPAVGKHTVARELVARTGFELYHNHTVVDAVLARHAFGTPEFVAERDHLWRTHLSAAPARGIAGLVFTFNPENSVPQAFIDWLFGTLGRTDGVTLLSVALVATEAVIESRLDAASRREFRKLTDLELYRRLRAEGAFLSPVIPHSDLVVETSRQRPEQAAEEILGFLRDRGVGLR
jgi:hypothetical protein